MSRGHGSPHLLHETQNLPSTPSMTLTFNPKYDLDLDYKGNLNTHMSKFTSWQVFIEYFIALALLLFWSYTQHKLWITDGQGQPDSPPSSPKVMEA